MHTAVLADSFDNLLRITYVVLVLAAPLIGYWLMVIDLRAWLRAMKGTLMVVKNHLTGVPEWARQYTPNCISSLGLELPCEEEDIKRAYRQLAETMHPDRGGDRQKFMALQRHCEEAIEFIRAEDSTTA